MSTRRASIISAKCVVGLISADSCRCKYDNDETRRDGVGISSGIPPGGLDGLLAQRVGAGGPFCLPQPLHPARVLHHLDRRLVVLCALADLEPAHGGHGHRQRHVRHQAMLRLHFGGLSLVGQPSISGPAGLAAAARRVHVVPGGLDVRQSASRHRKAASRIAGLHFAGLEQPLCRRLLFPLAQEESLRRRGHVVPGFPALGHVPGELPLFPSNTATSTAPGFLWRRCCNSSSP